MFTKEIMEELGTIVREDNGCGRGVFSRILADYRNVLPEDSLNMLDCIASGDNWSHAESIANRILGIDSLSTHFKSTTVAMALLKQIKENKMNTIKTIRKMIPEEIDEMLKDVRWKDLLVAAGYLYTSYLLAKKAKSRVIKD